MEATSNPKGPILTQKKLEEMYELFKTDTSNSRNKEFKNFISSKIDKTIKNPLYIVPEVLRDRLELEEDPQIIYSNIDNVLIYSKDMFS
jgi:hydroxylamine reductase (hybrid-cluster protein)